MTTFRVLWHWHRFKIVRGTVVGTHTDRPYTKWTYSNSNIINNDFTLKYTHCSLRNSLNIRITPYGNIAIPFLSITLSLVSKRHLTLSLNCRYAGKRSAAAASGRYISVKGCIISKVKLFGHEDTYHVFRFSFSYEFVFERNGTPQDYLPIIA